MRNFILWCLLLACIVLGAVKLAGTPWALPYALGVGAGILFVFRKTT